MDTEVIDVQELVHQHLKKALDASSGRSAVTLYGGRDKRLRHTLIAIRAGEGLAEHESPGEATLQVMHGTIVLKAGDESWTLKVGQFVAIPDLRHSVDVLEDAAFILSVATVR